MTEIPDLPVIRWDFKEEVAGIECFVKVEEWGQNGDSIGNTNPIRVQCNRSTVFVSSCYLGKTCNTTEQHLQYKLSPDEVDSGSSALYGRGGSSPLIRTLRSKDLGKLLSPFSISGLVYWG